MNTGSRYPQGEGAPVDRFDARDSQQALETADVVARPVAAELSR